jgi:hypothetical protein
MLVSLFTKGQDVGIRTYYSTQLGLVLALSPSLCEKLPL